MEICKHTGCNYPQGECYGTCLMTRRLDKPRDNVSSLKVQVAGSHYKDLKIQPIEYIHANNIPFAEGSAIKYLTRWRAKGGIDDLKKARHFIDLLIELETREVEK